MNKRMIAVAIVVGFCALLFAGFAATRGRGVAQPEVQTTINQPAPAAPSPTTPESIPLAAAAAPQENSQPEAQTALAVNQRPSAVSPGLTLETIPRIAPATLQEKIERNEVVVIDVRDIDSYTASHIPGAMQIPLAYIESELPYLPRSKPIVTYCT